MLTKDMCPIDFNMSAEKVHNKIRGLSASPCATALYDGKRLKIYKSTMSDGKKYDAAPGTIVNEKDFTVVCGDGLTVTFTEIQAEGGKRMKTADYLRGKPVTKGTVLE
jgi:methionyl-tRNA formyltransferase